MSQFPDDIVEGEFASEDQKSKRLNEIEYWLNCFKEDHFKTFGEKIQIAEDGASRVNSCYWESIEESVRPHLIPNGSKVLIDRHKIASTTELCVCYHEPIIDSDPERRTEINSRLAYCIGLTIIANWNPGRIKSLFVSDQFNREHLTWLSEVSRNKNDFPIFSNAATWYLIELICEERSKYLNPNN